MKIWVVFVTTLVSGVLSQGNDQQQQQQQQQPQPQQQFISQQSQLTPQQQQQQLSQQSQQIPQQVQQVSQQVPQLQQAQPQPQQQQQQQQQAPQPQQQQPQNVQSVPVQQNAIQPQNKPVIQTMTNPSQLSGNQSPPVARLNSGSSDQNLKSGDKSQDGKQTTLHPCLSHNISECFALISAQMNKTEELLQMANRTLGKKANPLENATRAQSFPSGLEPKPDQNNAGSKGLQQQQQQQQQQPQQGQFASPQQQQPKQQPFQTIQRQRRSAQEIIVETSGKSKGRQKITEIEDPAESENEDLEVEPMSVIHKEAEDKVDTVVDVENLTPDKVEAAAAGGKKATGVVQSQDYAEGEESSTGPPKKGTAPTGAPKKETSSTEAAKKGTSSTEAAKKGTSSTEAAKMGSTSSGSKGSSTLSPTTGTGSPGTGSTVSGLPLETTTTLEYPTIPGWFSLDIAAKRKLLANLTMDVTNKTVASNKIPIYALGSYPFLRHLFKRDTEHLHEDVEASIASLNAQKDHTKQQFQKLFSASKKMDLSNQEERVKSGSSLLFNTDQRNPKIVENNIENTLAQIESLEEMIQKRLKPLFASIPKDDEDLMVGQKAQILIEEKLRPKRELPNESSPPVETQSNTNFQQSPILNGQSPNQIQPIGNGQQQLQQQQQSQSNVPQTQTGMSQGVQQPLSGSNIQNSPFGGSGVKTGNNQIMPNVPGTSVQGVNGMQQASLGQQNSVSQPANLNQNFPNTNQTNSLGNSQSQNNSSNMPAIQGGLLGSPKTNNNLLFSPQSRNQMNGSNINTFGGAQNPLNNTPNLQTKLKPEDEEAKELSTAPKGLVLVVKEPGQSNLVSGQLVDGNLNPLNDSSTPNTMNNNAFNNRNSGFQHKNVGEKAGPRGIMIQEVFNRNQQNKGNNNLHLQTLSSVNVSNIDNNGTNSNSNQNSKQGISLSFSGQQNTLSNNSNGLQFPNPNNNNPFLVNNLQQRNNNGLDNNQPSSLQQGQSINFSPGSSSPLNMTNSLRKDDSNKMSEKGQQVRVMQPVGDRVSLHEANGASSERVQSAKESSRFDKVEAQPIFIDWLAPSGANF